ncbi:alpha/beta fold hydrolase [Salsipaludibacter albus]|uniref:alpha/beta fold hydrolase n=1 Tax=Salsipaludibacter albus TaxID=2849650 RepID=UPI001EE49741|nr:alpha/beta hydrolase [Salsipaludibacter albus]
MTSPATSPSGDQAAAREREVPEPVEPLRVGLSRGPVEVLDLPADPEKVDTAPLVFLHEGLGSLRLWRSFPADVHAATGRRTVVWSRHGHGDSAVVTAPRDVTYMHEEAVLVLPELLARLDLVAPVLVGHSDGASIALINAASSRAGLDVEPPTAVVAMAPHVVVEDVSIDGITAAREAWETSDLPARMARHHRDASATFWGWNRIWLDPAFRDWDITPYLPGIGCPVLGVQGRDDQYGTMHQLDLLQAGVAGPFTRVELDDCRHAPHLDRPDATRAAVVDFLAGLP